MKQVMIAGFSALSFSIALPSTAAVASTHQNNSVELAPVTLVTMAYRGYFSDRGIPSHLKFLSEYTLGRISAEKLVQTAIEARLLPPEAVNDSYYLNAVRNQLESQLPLY